MLLRQLKAGDADARVEMGLRGTRGQSQRLEKRGRSRVSGDVLWVRSRGSNIRGDGDGMSRFSGGLMAAATDCQALDFDYRCPVACSRGAVMADMLVESVISDVGHTNARNGLCRPVSEGPADRPRVGVIHGSLLRGSPVEGPPCPRGGKKRSSVRGQKGTWTIITRCFDVDMTAVSLQGHHSRRGLVVAIYHTHCVLTGAGQHQGWDWRRFQRVTPGRPKRGSAVETRQARQHHGPPAGQMQL